MKKIRHIAKILALIMTLVLLAQSGLPGFAAETISTNTPSVESSFAETDNGIDADDADDAKDAGNADDHGVLLGEDGAEASESDIASTVTPAPADIRA